MKCLRCKKEMKKIKKYYVCSCGANIRIWKKDEKTT